MMRYVIWSNAGKFEWVIYKDEEIFERSGLIYNSKREAEKELKNKSLSFFKSDVDVIK